MEEKGIALKPLSRLLPVLLILLFCLESLKEVQSQRSNLMLYYR